jgi:hypothetical protein
MAVMDVRKVDKQGCCYICLNMKFMSNSSLHQNYEKPNRINYQLAEVYVKINPETFVSKRTPINK